MVVFFTLIVGLTGFISLTSIGNSSVKTIHNVTILNDIYDNNVFIDTGLFNMLYISDSTLTGYVVQTTKEHAEHLLVRLNEYVAIQDQFSDVFTPGEMQDMANLLEIYTESYIPVAYEIFDLVEQGRREEALSVYINRLSPIYSTFTYYLNVGFVKNLENSDVKMKRNNDDASFNVSFMLTLVVMSLIVSVVLALAVTKSIAVPLAGLGEAAEKVANGELDVQFEQSRSNDEIAQLSLRLEETLYHLNQVQQLKLEAIEARHEKEKAEAASKSKDEFLAKMSHEIRTPMNAIIGMAELALREDMPDAAREHIITIKQAGTNLLSIINDILDFSKIESGKLEIVPVKYQFSSLVNDTINIIRMRLMEKPLRFFTNIDGNIPNNLVGDEVRMRQIILNLLSNAVKYSVKGHIGLTITVDKQDDKQVWIRITVADTGKGIKPEDQGKLFSEFTKVDVKKNQGIEGTGLGLVITKRLCVAMGGDINMESEYGKGSEFTAVIPQGVETGAPFAAIEEPEKKRILVYEGRSIYAGAVCWTLENMKIPYTMVTNQDDFAAALYQEEWFYIFSGYGLYERIKPLLEEQGDAAFPGGKKPPLALMVEWGTEAYIPNVRFVSIPVQALSIANVLNGRADNKGYIKSSDIIRFSFPGARLLVVDDIATNLKVVEGLLAPYRVSVDTCLNGLQAIELVRRAASEKREYDIIFMDHMMPEMDGIETTTAIRALEGEYFRNVPIIALTANAVVGMREMFIEKDFNDFLSKPIDVSKLDEILNRWIPEEKREKGTGESDPVSQGTTSNQYRNSNKDLPIPSPQSPVPSIPGIDVQKGITMTGGTVAAYRQVLSLFRKDAQDRLSLLQEAPETDALSSFTTHVHALKSASASIGAQEISAQAAELEAAGKAGDVAFIREHLPGFARQLTELIGGIGAALETDKNSGGMTNNDAAGKAAGRAAGTAGDSAALVSLLGDLESALKAQKSADIDRIMEELNQKPLDAQTREALEKISDDVLMTEFESALKTIDEVLRT
jgi:signal transduction histidine kinase/CheY-like chemotaxis protein/HPt (histidine-containing phosphotransfer) domain-containing protein